MEIPPHPAEGHHLDETFADLGAVLVDAGNSVTDVRIALDDVRDSAAPDADLSFAVLPSAVFVSSEGAVSARGGSVDVREHGAVVMRNVSEGELSIRQSAHAGRLVQRLRSGETPLTDTARAIRAIRELPFSHRGAAWIIGSGLISFGLAVLFRCPWWSVIVATCVGLIVGAVTTLIRRVRGAVAAVPFVAAFISTGLVGLVARGMDLGPVPLFAVCAPIAILVPGVLITNALLELTATDIVTGSARLVYGLIVLGFMGAGIVAGGAVSGLKIDPDSAALIADTTILSSAHSGWSALPPLWVAWVGVAVLAIGVAWAFGAGIRLAVLGVIVMLATYVVLALLSPVVGSVVATGITAAALFIAARLIERSPLALPTSVSFQSAFLLLVPGTVGLVALATFDAEDLASALFVFVSLCIGIQLGSVLADTRWPTIFAPRAPRRSPNEKENSV